MRYHEMLYVGASEEEVNQLVRGELVSHASVWAPHRGVTRLNKDEVGVLFAWDGDTARPIAFVADDQRHQRLFGRFAQLRGEFSPLTAWGHSISPRMFEALDELRRTPIFNGFEAAWAGLSIAEGQLLSGAPPSRLRIASCYATASYAVGRAIALWRQETVSSIREKYEHTRMLLGNVDSSQSKLIEILEPIWRCLAQVTLEERAPPESIWPIADALASLSRAEVDPAGEARWQALWPVFAVAPSDVIPNTISDLGPEARLKLFDRLILSLSKTDRKADAQKYYGLSLIAGFVATVAAGGSPSISLATEVAGEHPTVLAWAYVVGSVGERLTWTSSFEGLGRLVARELERPLHIDEQPMSDFAYSEMKVLYDRALSDPLVHLKIKQARTVQIALSPGVNVVFPLGDQRDRSLQANRTVARAGEGAAKTVVGDPIANFVDALWPYLEKKLEGGRKNVGGPRGRGGKSQAVPSEQEQDLPFGDKSRSKRV